MNRRRPLARTTRMSPLVLRRVLRRSRRSVAAVAVMGVLAVAVLAHHSMPTGMHVTPGMPAGTICLAVLAAGAVSMAAGFMAGPRIPFPRFSSAERLRSLIDSAPRSVPARAGPIELSVLRL